MHPQKWYLSYINQLNMEKIHLINIKCNDSDSFKYFILLYLYYYNIKNNYNRPSERDKHKDPYIHIYFNNNNDIYQFEKDNLFIDLLITDINDKPIFLTCNKPKIKATIVKLNDHRYSLYKPTLECFNDNITEINRIDSIPPKIYKLTDKIKEDLRFDHKYIV